MSHLIKYFIFIVLIYQSTAKTYEVPTNQTDVWIYDPEEIESVSFQLDGDYSKLEVIYVKNQLLDLKAAETLIEDLKNVPSVKDLNLESNKIDGVLDIGKLQLLKGLERFEINNNTISSLVCTAENEIPSVNIMSFDSNSLTLIDLYIFKKFPNLKELGFNDNKITGAFDLGKLQPLKKLTEFWIGGNQLTDILNTATENMPSVTKFDISNNKLTILDLSVFTKFVNLEEIWLHENHLMTIDGYENAKSVLPKINSITVNQNNFVCSNLETMVAPFDEEFWTSRFSETSCPGQKSKLFKETACCYPTFESLLKDIPTAKIKVQKADVSVVKKDNQKLQEIIEKIDKLTKIISGLSDDIQSIRGDINKQNDQVTKAPAARKRRSYMP